MGAMVLWSPFYSKINTFNSIIYVDWILGLGMATLTETNNREEVLNNRNVETQESHTGIMWNIGAKFYLTSSWHVKFDLTTVHFKATPARGDANVEDEYYSNYDLIFSLGYNF